MLGFIRRRQTRPVRAAARFVVESLEARKLLDGTVYNSAYPDPSQDPNGNNYYGASTSISGLGQWHQGDNGTWDFSTSNLPAHTHVSMEMSVGLSIQIDPNTGYSTTDNTTDNGYVYLAMDGNVITAWDLNNGTQQNYDPNVDVSAGLTWIAAYGLNDQDSVSFSMWATSPDVWFYPSAVTETAGISAGWKYDSSTDAQGNPTHYVERGGAPGTGNGMGTSMTLQLDGPLSENTNLYIASPKNGCLVGAQPPYTTSDGQRAYFEFDAPRPPTFVLDTGYTNSDTTDDIYRLAMQKGSMSQEFDFEMPAPYWNYDYANGINLSVDPIQPDDTTLPVQAGFSQPYLNTSIFYPGSQSPTAYGLSISPDTMYDPPLGVFFDSASPAQALRITNDVYYGNTADLDAALTQDNNSEADWMLIRSIFDPNNPNLDSPYPYGWLQGWEQDGHGFADIPAFCQMLDNHYAPGDANMGYPNSPIPLYWYQQGQVLKALDFSPIAGDYYEVKVTNIDNMTGSLLVNGNNIMNNGAPVQDYIYTPQQAAGGLQVFLAGLRANLLTASPYVGKLQIQVYAGLMGTNGQFISFASLGGYSRTYYDFQASFSEMPITQ